MATTTLAFSNGTGAALLVTFPDSAAVRFADTDYLGNVFVWSASFTQSDNLFTKRLLGFLG
jgi:hypothetical protein